MKWFLWMLCGVCGWVQHVHATENVQVLPRVRLKDRIPPVSGRLYVQDRTWEMYAAVGSSLSDPLVVHSIGRIQGVYHFTETYGLACALDGVWSYPQVNRVVGGNPGRQVFDTLRGRAQVSFLWAPLYGKLSWFASRPVHFNTYLTVGPSALYTLHSGVHAGVHVGLGQRFWVSRKMALRVEALSDVFAWDRVPGAEGRARWQSWMSLHVGVSYSFGGPHKEPVLW
jgi:outer membrane beta-barrel protein